MAKKEKHDEEMGLVMQERKKLFDKTIDKAQKYIMGKKYESGARYIQIACNYASHSHAGIFYSDVAEKLLKEISSNSIENKMSKGFRCNSNDPIIKVLHVATEVYDVGGHTRLIQNWMEYDSQRINDLVITNQTEKESPKKVIDSFKQKGSIVHFLIDDHKSILQRSQILLNISTEYDVIILHIHPYDVIPSISFSHANVPILFLNHADHRFWIGRNISNIVLEIRDSGMLLSNKRRGINCFNQVILPIPLQPPINVSKQEARVSLNFTEEELVIFSVASSYKYKSTQGKGLEQILIPLISQYTNLKVIVAGPDPSERYWQELYKQSEGRIEAIGIQPSIDYYYIASDLYLDSYPVSSLTSLLDAAKYGVPIFSIEKGTTGLNLDDIALEKLEYKSKSIDKIIEQMSQYIIDLNKREEFGKECFEQVNKYHTGLGWISLLNGIYNKVGDFTKAKNQCASSTIINKYDYPLVYMHHKERSIEYEYISAFNCNFEMLPFIEKIRFYPLMFKLLFKEPVIVMKVMTPRKIKNLIKRILSQLSIKL